MRVSYIKYTLTATIECFYFVKFLSEFIASKMTIKYILVLFHPTLDDYNLYYLKLLIFFIKNYI